MRIMIDMVPESTTEETLHLSASDWGGTDVAQIEIKPSDFVLVGQEQIMAQTGVPIEGQILSYRAQRLESTQSWAFYSIPDGSVIQLTIIEITPHPVTPRSLPIYIKFSYNRKIREVLIAEEDTVRYATLSLEETDGIPFAVQRLTYCGKSLDADKSFSFYRIQKHSTMFLNIRSLGPNESLLTVAARCYGDDELRGVLTRPSSILLGRPTSDQISLALIQMSSIESQQPKRGTAILQTLIDFGADVNYRGHEGVTACEAAAVVGNHTALRQILCCGRVDHAFRTANGLAIAMVAASCYPFFLSILTGGVSGFEIDMNDHLRTTELCLASM